MLTHATLNFNLLGGMSLEEAKRMAETINDSVLDFPSHCPAATLCLRNQRSELLECQKKKPVVRIASSMDSSILQALRPHCCVAARSVRPYATCRSPGWPCTQSSGTPEEISVH